MPSGNPPGDPKSILASVLDGLDKLSGPYCSPFVLDRAITTALSVPAPAGDPATIRSQAEIYGTATDTAETTRAGLASVVASDLPQSLKGKTADYAADALNAVSTQCVGIHDGFATGRSVLNDWADQLSSAQSSDTSGRNQLHDAARQLAMVSPVAMRFGAALSDMPNILAAVKSGCQDMLTGANVAQSGAQSASTALRMSAFNARARQITVPGMDPLDAVTVAYTDGGIPSANAMSRASAMLKDPQTQATFDQLVGQASSQAEIAYLWKALGAGYTGEQLTEFDQAIHPHANDLDWLTTHLEPEVNDPNTSTGADSKLILSYKGMALMPQNPGGKGWYYYYSQGGYGDCVAASTVVGKLTEDPVQMLGLTTGLGPAAVGGANTGDDSAQAAHNRMQNLYVNEYHAAQSVDGTLPNNNDGIGPNGQIMLDSSLLTPATGSDYHIQPVDDPSSRTAALPAIQAAVADGKPVPIDVHGQVEDIVPIPHHRPEVTYTDAAHQMVIVGATANQLEIYNPWGFTEWVSDDQFVNGELGSLTSDYPDTGLDQPTAVQLPQ